MATGQSLAGRILLWLAGPSPPNTKHMVKAFIGWGVTVGLILWGLTSLGSLISDLLGLPQMLGLSPEVRIIGYTMIMIGTTLSLWLVRYRHPLEMIVSTYYTFVKMFTLTPISKPEGRTEPLVIKGPQKYVRSPLYLGALIIFLGWDIVTDATASLVGFLFIVTWFRLMQIPFEERELRALFGEEYVRYSNDVPMLIPFTKHNKKYNRSLSLGST